MPTISNMNELFVDMLKDVYYAEKKILKSLPKMAKAAGKESDLAQAFETHRQETEGQIQRLEQVFGIVGEKPKAKKCEAIEGLSKEAEELMEEVDCECTMHAGLLASAQAVEHYEIARYGTLVEWAKLLGHEDAAELLQETLDEEKKTDQLLTEMATSSVNQEAVDAMNSSDEEEGDEEEEEEETPRTNNKRNAA